jgi:hypothetical protein
MSEISAATLSVARNVACTALQIANNVIDAAHHELDQLRFVSAIKELRDFLRGNRESIEPMLAHIEAARARLSVDPVMYQGRPGASAHRHAWEFAESVWDEVTNAIDIAYCESHPEAGLRLKVGDRLFLGDKPPFVAVTLERADGISRIRVSKLAEKPPGLRTVLSPVINYDRAVIELNGDRIRMRLRNVNPSSQEELDGLDLKIKMEVLRAIAEPPLPEYATPKSPSIRRCGLGKAGPQKAECPGDEADDDKAMTRVLATLDSEHARIIAIANRSDLVANVKLRAICQIDARFYGKDSNEIGHLIGISPASVRQLDWWKVDRKEYYAEQKIQRNVEER